MAAQALLASTTTWSYKIILLKAAP